MLLKFMDFYLSCYASVSGGGRSVRLFWCASRSIIECFLARILRVRQRQRDEVPTRWCALRTHKYDRKVTNKIRHHQTRAPAKLSTSAQNRENDHIVLRLIFKAKSKVVGNPRNALPLSCEHSAQMVRTIRADCFTDKGNMVFPEFQTNETSWRNATKKEAHDANAVVPLQC